jgi:hypothetical protein
MGKLRGIRGANLTLQLKLLGGAIEGLGGSESTSISATCVTRSARAAYTEEAPDRRKEGGVEDIDKSDDGGKKQRALVLSRFSLKTVGLHSYRGLIVLFWFNILNLSP